MVRLLALDLCYYRKWLIDKKNGTAQYRTVYCISIDRPRLKYYSFWFDDAYLYDYIAGMAS